jgi:hypothetical protein
MILVATGKQGRPRRGAHGAVGIKIIKAHSGFAQLVNMRGTQVFGTVVGHIVVALVIGQNKQDVRFPDFCLLPVGAEGQTEQQIKEDG